MVAGDDAGKAGLAGHSEESSARSRRRLNRAIKESRRDLGAELSRRVDSGMNSALDDICADYADAELELLAGFLRRAAEAGRAAATRLADG